MKKDVILLIIAILLLFATALIEWNLYFWIVWIMVFIGIAYWYQSKKI